VDAVLIDHDHRFRRRLMLTTLSGRQVLLDLPRATRLRHGDGLLLDDGDVIRVAAKTEQLLDIHAPDAATLTRIAWHLGNRHLELELRPDGLRIRADHVIAAMVEGLGGAATPVQAAFNPEPGAYDHA
jgi:urease accessory protein